MGRQCRYSLRKHHAKPYQATHGGAKIRHRASITVSPCYLMRCNINGPHSRFIPEQGSAQYWTEWQASTPPRSILQRTEDPGNWRTGGRRQTGRKGTIQTRPATLPYRTILGEPLGPENIGALGSIKEGRWVRKWRAIGLKIVDSDLWIIWTLISGAFGL